jgi:hypothetical protein
MFKSLPILSDATFTPTLEIHMAAMLILLIASNYKDACGVTSNGITYIPV